MSSDEEGPDGSLVSRPPSWQSDKFNKLKCTLDKEYLTFCSAKSKRLLVKKTRGPTKLCQPPDVPPELGWILEVPAAEGATASATSNDLGSNC
ncbi:hypothetical protein KUTeg_005714 [Tegillarca granosa]|uniref:Uncharacterized protein n=1 Tax=Tegillarca granosa TaxID=220873 RepID=A0ABQ9FM30_TEGGR|nr:hypothetical protein KUTeg_005714 [Tegillarca granosa]